MTTPSPEVATPEFGCDRGRILSLEYPPPPPPPPPFEAEGFLNNGEDVQLVFLAGVAVCDTSFGGKGVSPLDLTGDAALDRLLTTSLVGEGVAPFDLTGEETGLPGCWGDLEEDCWDLAGGRRGGDLER